MKNRSYANRGEPFEQYLRFANERYAHHKIAVIDKMPTEFKPIRNNAGKICSVKVEHKSRVDFIGRYFHHPIAFEAKHTQEDSIRFDEVQPHQADYLDAFTEEPGTIGLVVLSFDHKRYFVVPWAFWSVAYEYRVRRNDRKTPITVSAFGQTWIIPQKFSVRIEELNPSWEIPNHNYTFGLHYLEPAGKYVVENQQPKISENKVY